MRIRTAIVVALSLVSAVPVWAADSTTREYLDRVGKLAAAEFLKEVEEDDASFNGGIADHGTRVRHLLESNHDEKELGIVAAKVDPRYRYEFLGYQLGWPDGPGLQKIVAQLPKNDKDILDDEYLALAQLQREKGYLDDSVTTVRLVKRSYRRGRGLSETASALWTSGQKDKANKLWEEAKAVAADCTGRVYCSIEEEMLHIADTHCQGGDNAGGIKEIESVQVTGQLRAFLLHDMTESYVGCGATQQAIALAKENGDASTVARLQQEQRVENLRRSGTIAQIRELRDESQQVSLLCDVAERAFDEGKGTVAREALGYASQLDIYQSERYDTMYDKYQVGLAAAQTDNDQLGKDALQRLLNLVPHGNGTSDDYHLKHFIAVLLSAMGRFEEADSYMEQLKDDSQACEFVGANHLYRGEPESSIEWAMSQKTATCRVGALLGVADALSDRMASR